MTDPADIVERLRMDVKSAQSRATTAERQRTAALDGHRLDDEMIDQLRTERDRYRKALERIRVAADPGEGGWRHVAKLRRNIAVDALAALSEPEDR